MAGTCQEYSFSFCQLWAVNSNVCEIVKNIRLYVAVYKILKIDCSLIVGKKQVQSIKEKHGPVMIF